VTGAAGEAVREQGTDSVTFAFGDAGAQLYGLARLGLSRDDDGGERRGSALALLFSGREPVAALARGGLPVADGASWEALELAGVRATVEAPRDRWTVAFDGDGGQGFALEFSAFGAAAELDERDPAAALGGMAGYDQPCRVRGTVRAGGRQRSFSGLGQRGRSWGDADWERIDLARTVCAWTDGACAALTAIRPAGAADHASEATWAAVWEPEGVLAVDDGRLSTTYDAEGHARRAGFELWPRDAEWPRRAAGEVLCGSSLELGSLRLDCAFFQWRLEGRAGVGRYDILRRAA
jgi:hypothetical protein